MLVELGNPAAHQADGEGGFSPLPTPAVTYVSLPVYPVTDNGDDYLYDVQAGTDVRDVALHLAQNPDVTHLPGHEALLSIVHATGGLWARHGAEKPTWVHVEDDILGDTAKAAELERQLAEFYGCPRGRPADVEATHYTHAGPPGVGVDA